MYQNYYQPNPVQAANYSTLGARTQTPSLKGRPVSSIDEARASTIDFDGSVFYFPDLANKRIYTKQINVDGTATLLMYELKELPVDQPPFVTREEFENTINQIKGLLTQPVTSVEEPKPAPPQEYNF